MKNHYEYLSNIITYRDGRLWRGSKLADVNITTNGYRRVNFRRNGKKHSVYAHRLTWYLCNGYEPTNQIDHIDGDKLNNDIENLRDVDNYVNNQNRYCKGCSYIPSRNKWHTSIKYNGVSKFLGMFDTEAEANAAYRAAKRCYHPEAREELH